MTGRPQVWDGQEGAHPQSQALTQRPSQDPMVSSSPDGARKVEPMWEGVSGGVWGRHSPLLPDLQRGKTPTAEGRPGLQPGPEPLAKPEILPGEGEGCTCWVSDMWKDLCTAR